MSMTIKVIEKCEDRIYYTDRSKDHIVEIYEVNGDTLEECF